MFFTSIICVMELRHGSRRREDHAVFWPRITHKVARALKRPPAHALISFVADICQSSVESVNLPNGIDCVITSPPYMNALDYGRDNRLRLWFLGEPYLESLDRALTGFGG